MQHVHTGETGADDHRIEYASLLQLGVLIRHAFSDVLFIRFFRLPGMWGYVASVGSLFRRHSVRNSGATSERLITEGRLPVPGDDELSTIQKLSSIQESPGKIGAIEYSLEEVRTLEMGT
jgi:hypothetical protein